jgi:hypothetical protein
MHIARTLSVHDLHEHAKQSDYTKGMSGEERISLLEELRYDLGKFLRHDYSGRFERSVSVVQRKEC